MVMVHGPGMGPPPYPMNLANLSPLGGHSGRGLWAIWDRKMGDISYIGGDQKHKRKRYASS